MVFSPLIPRLHHAPRSLKSRLPLVSTLAIALVLASSLTWSRSAHAAFAEVEADKDAKNQTLLQADSISYDDDANTVTAEGYVEIQRGDRILLADKIVFNRTTDIATATGNVSMIEADGTAMFFEKAQVTGDFKEGLAEEVRVLMTDKSRMAARVYRRLPNGTSELDHGVYSACDSCTGQVPLWQIKASHVRYDPDAEMVYYHNAWVEFGGVPLFYSPYLAHPDPTSGPKSGLLLPTIGASRNLGFSVKQPYYIHISPETDATLTPFITSDAGKGAIGQYREDFAEARLRIDGSLMADDPGFNDRLRGHLNVNAGWDMDDAWRSGTDINLASDRTYLRRYNFLAPTWLTSNLFAERFGANSYFSANAYYFQRQRAPTTTSGSIPGVLPLLSYNYTGDPDSIGGYWDVDANGLVLIREAGNDTNRAATRVGWNLPYTASYGAVYTFRTDVRAEGYYVRDLPIPGQPNTFSGTAGRVTPEASLEWQMPFVSDSMGFHQILEPIAMAVISPIGGNKSMIPNEDSLDLQFDDTNLFTMQRFTGLDRIETGARINYGVHWATFSESIGTIDALVGQVYRFHNDATFAPLSGLQGHLSDYVGHVDLTPSPYFTLQYRFRLDKDNFASRRSEVTASMGPELLRLSTSYLFVKGGSTLSSPLDTQELYVVLSSRFSQHWNVVASHRQDLGLNGGAIRTEAGVQYEDECVVIGIDFAKDNTQDRDFKKGIAVLLRLNMKTIGDIKFNTDVGTQR